MLFSLHTDYNLSNDDNLYFYFILHDTRFFFFFFRMLRFSMDHSFLKCNLHLPFWVSFVIWLYSSDFGQTVDEIRMRKMRGIYEWNEENDQIFRSAWESFYYSYRKRIDCKTFILHKKVIFLIVFPNSGLDTPSETAKLLFRCMQWNLTPHHISYSSTASTTPHRYSYSLQ